MDPAEWEELVRRWDARDERWEERDRRWEERDRQWKEHHREHSKFMRELWTRIEMFNIESAARHEQLLGQMKALTEATWKMLDRFGEGPTPQS